MRMRVLVLLLCLALVAACGGSGAASTTSTAAEGGATTTSSADTTTSAGTEETTTTEATTTTVAEEMSLALVQGETGGMSFSRLPAAATRDRLNEAGWEIETVNFSAVDLTVEAVSSGTVDIGRFQVLDALRAIQAGGNLKIIAADRPDEFVVITPIDVTDCADTADDRVATHSESSTYTFLHYYWMETICGLDLSATERLIIAGGENRIIALMNDQIDSTNVQMADFINLEAQAPGEFHILANFSQEIPGLVGGVIAANTDWLAANRAMAVDYLAEALRDLHDANVDGTAIRAAAEEYQSEADAAAFDTVRQVYLDDLGGFPECGIFDAEVGQTLIGLFEGLDMIDAGLTADTVFDLSVLDDARAAVDHC